MQIRRSISMSFFLLFIIFFSCGGPQPAANIDLPSLFSDHMVLQREMDVPVWGTADPNGVVTVEFMDQKVSSLSDDAGEWKVVLKPLKAGGPHELKVSGMETYVFRDVLVGEVWLGSGQSNMEMPLAGWGKVKNYEQEIADASYPDIRLFQVSHKMSLKPEKEVPSKGWRVCTPETIPDFSSTAYFFGRMLHKELEVPVGLIHSSWGGTIIEAWMSPESLQPLPGYDQRIVKLHNITEPLQKQSVIPPHFPTVLSNGMIEPLIPYAFRGVIWYQGEANTGSAHQYRDLFPRLIRDWRKRWTQGNFPFLFVQLANFMPVEDQPGENSWAELREAQFLTLSEPNTGMAVAIDIGDAEDIHPKNKQEVGRRLALNALRIAYKQDVVASGPIYRSMQIENEKMRLTFSNIADGLVIKNGEDLEGFAIAGEDRVFRWAEGAIDGDTVVLWHPQIKEPVAARYAWASNPICNLYNSAGLPASPFRTDDWPGITEH